MEVLSIILGIVYALICCALVVIVLSQEGKEQGLGAIGGGYTPDTYWNKIKGRSREGMLKKGTAVLAGLFVVLSVVLSMSFLN
ncbi:MAG: preprotein translocase subunit SecG [Lachnospiraceae bacterium]|nr:preprotein translocase subunit SecG [Lachnospiraceae bacterium]